MLIAIIFSLIGFILYVILWIIVIRHGIRIKQIEQKIENLDSKIWQLGLEKNKKSIIEKDIKKNTNESKNSINKSKSM